MSDQERDPEEAEKADAGEAREAQEADGEFELPLPDEENEPGRRLRRGLFGYRADDVEAAIASRDETLTVLRRDVAALWLAFGQHERAIRQLLAAVEALGGPRVEPPGKGEGDASAGPAPGSAGSPAKAAGAVAAGSGAGTAPESAEAIGAQLAGLDEVLAAIEQATQSLERAYAGEIGAAEGERGDPDPADEGKPDRPEEDGARED